MKKIEILNAKIDFCRNMLKYKRCVEGNYRTINNLVETIEVFKRLGVLEDINVNRSDTIMHNKLMETLKDFKKHDIDPFFFCDSSSNDYYPASFYTRYILLYLSDNILLMHGYLDKIVNELSLLTKDMEHITRHFFKIIFSSIRGGNMILEDRNCQEKMNHIREEYYHYQDKLNELYEFDVKKDYFNIIRMVLDNVFKEENKDKLDFATAIFMQYNIDVDFLNKIGREDELSTLKELYLKHLEEFKMSSDILDGEFEPYFTSILPISEEIFEYSKLSSKELYDLLVDLESQKVMLMSGGEFTGDAPKDIADLMMIASEIESIKEQEKKLKK